MVNRGDTPHVYDGLPVDYSRLLYSEFDYVLSLPIQLSAGYGTLKQGTAIAKNLSALTTGNKGQYVPYNPTTVDDGAAYQPGRAFLIDDIASGESTFQVTLSESYKFKVGDDVIINTDAAAAVNGGAITAIDRTTYSHKAEITFTTAITNGAPIADAACAAVEAGTSGNGFSDCVGILAGAVETGTGENAKGGAGVLMISNFTMYSGMAWNFDAAAITDLSAVDFGKYTVVK